MSIHDANEIDTNRVIRCETKALQFKASCMALSASYSACLNHSNDISHRN